MTASARQYAGCARPSIAMITNHGYAGAEIPFGGAPDTGGQNQYVNSLAVALDRLGYRVTIFARGGFPHFESDRIRKEPEYLTDHIRYVFVQGGGSEFIRKEDIAVALDEEIEWLDRFIRAEAEEIGVAPWDAYELLNTHYWDAGIIGDALVRRWRNDVAAKWLVETLNGVVPSEMLHALRGERHRRALGDNVTYHLGRTLLDATKSPDADLMKQVRLAATTYAAARSIDRRETERQITELERASLHGMQGGAAPAVLEIAAADALGRVLLGAARGDLENLEAKLSQVDRHVWTPHSLGMLKQENYRGRPPEVCRDLKFCERRSHERVVCSRARAFAATSSEIAERLHTHYGVPSDRIFYFPPCNDGTVFRPHSDAETESTYRYLVDISGIDLDVLRAGLIVFETSRMDHTKRKDVLLEAFAGAIRTRDNAYLFIGGGPENEVYRSLEALFDKHPVLKGRAFLTGFIPDAHIGPMFALADLFVSASEMEGFGMSLSQATAAGTAVVASDLIPYAVQYAGRDAMVIPAGDVAGLAAAMGKLLDDDEDRARRARNLHETAKAFEWEPQAAGFLDHLRSRGFSIARTRKEA